MVSGAVVRPWRYRAPHPTLSPLIATRANRLPGRRPVGFDPTVTTVFDGGEG